MKLFRVFLVNKEKNLDIELPIDFDELDSLMNDFTNNKKESYSIFDIESVFNFDLEICDIYELNTIALAIDEIIYDKEDVSIFESLYNEVSFDIWNVIEIMRESNYMKFSDCYSELDVVSQYIEEIGFLDELPSKYKNFFDEKEFLRYLKYDCTFIEYDFGKYLMLWL